MKHSTDELNPEIRGLLEEIAGQEGARLLKVGPRRARELLYPDAPRVSDRAALLTNAERHLLMVHRAEVGRMLYLQAVKLMLDDPALARLHDASVNEEWKLELPAAPELEERSQAAAQSLASSGPESAADLLGRCCSGRDTAQPADLLQAALRVAPSDGISVTIALDLIRQEDLRGAESVLHGVLAGGPSHLILVSAWHNLGLLNCRRGDYGGAAQAYTKVSSAPGAGVAPLLHLFYSYLQSGDERGFIETASRLDDEVSLGDETVRDYIQAQAEARDLGEWQLTPEALKLMAHLPRALGRTPNEITRHVFR